MTEKKIPEIILEVSCGGTFRVSTGELACRITVLPPGGTTASQMPLAATAAAPPPPQPVAPVVERVVDPFHAEAVRSCMEEVATMSETACASLGCSRAEDVPARIGMARDALRQATEKAGDSAAQLMTMLNKLQAQVVDLRFALTFLKNHAGLKARPAGNEEDVIIKAGEHSRIVAKIADAIKNAQGINDQLTSLKKVTGVQEISASGNTASLLALLGKVQGDVLAAVFTLGFMFEQKQAHADIPVEKARKHAREALAAFTGAARISSASSGMEPTPDQIEEVMRSIPEADTGTPGNTPGAAASQDLGIMDLGEEMSDEEALRKLQEFGL